MGTGHRSFEFNLLDQADKIRLVLVAFFLVIIFTAPREQIVHFRLAAVVLSFSALYAVFSHFVLNWQMVRREGQVHLMAALLVCTDILAISAFAWALGPEFRGLMVLLLLNVVFAAAFFVGLELPLVTGLVCGAHVLVHLTMPDGSHPWHLLVLSVGTTVVVAWMSYALAEVARRERATTDRIVKHLTEGVLLVTGQGDIVVMNPRLEHMVGVRADEVIGLNIFEPEHAEALARLLDIVADIPRQARSDEPVRARQLHIEDPTPLEVECLTVPCASEHRLVLAWVVVCKDVTAVMSTVRVKEEGLAVLSHELRGRLHSVRASSEVLIRMADTLAPQQRDELIQLLDSETRRLSTLLSRTLDAAGLEQGKVVFRFEPVDICAVASEVSQGLHAAAEEKGLSLEVGCDGPIPAVWADRARLDQVMQNLLENAIKFTPSEGRIKVAAAATPGGALVSVSDTGCGVSPEERETIFEKFTRGTGASRGHPPDSLGLGLHICREIIRHHKGAIGVQSGEGWASTFYFTVPYAPDREEEAAAAADD